MNSKIIFKRLNNFLRIKSELKQFLKKHSVINLEIILIVLKFYILESYFN